MERVASPVAYTEQELAAVRFGADGLVPAIVQDAGDGAVLMLGYMDGEALRRTLQTGRSWFWSRSRREYWCKGETSGDRQWVRSVSYDCDGDALLVVVDQDGNGACHTGARSCFYRSFRHRRPERGARERSGAPVSTPGSRPDRPGREVFTALCRHHRIVPVWREVVADTLTPVSAFKLVVGEQTGFLFESVEGGERWGRYSFVGRNPLATLVGRGRAVTAEGTLHLPADVRARRAGEGILATVDAMLSAYRSPDLDDLPPLHGGLVGYLGYDVVREVEHLPHVPPDDAGIPDAVLHVIGQLCAFDHWRQRVVLVDNVVVGEQWGEAEASAAFDAAGARLDDLAADLSRPVGGPPLEAPRPDDVAPEVTANMSSQAFRDSVLVAKEHIRAGDIFQVVLSQRFDLDLDAEPFDLYRVLRLVNPSPYLYFLRTEHCTVVGATPEPLVRLRDGVVVSRPIAGTRRRGQNDAEDDRLAGELAEHPKEVAEHVMLVDLARNDVGRVVRFGTEQVDEFKTVERYSHVMHLTSQVSGRLAPGKGPIDVLRATIPAGTLSGAPKVRAMQIIDDLEPTKRGVYGGVVGYVDFSGNLDTAIAIRTMVVTPDGRASVQAGAGIVADSDPAEEDIECHNKAAALLAAVPAARRATANAAAAAGAGPLR